MRAAKQNLPADSLPIGGDPTVPPDLTNEKGGIAAAPLTTDHYPLVYVPSDQLARYSSCSRVRRSILMPIDSSFSLATRLSSSSGTGKTFFSSVVWCFTRYSTERA